PGQGRGAVQGRPPEARSPEAEMTRTRLTLAASGLLSLAAGTLLGLRFRAHLDPAMQAAPNPALAPRPAPGPDFSAIARRATPAVVNISATQIYRTERSPFFSDPFFRDF